MIVPGGVELLCLYIRGRRASFFFKVEIFDLKEFHFAYERSKTSAYKLKIRIPEGSIADVRFAGEKQTEVGAGEHILMIEK